MNIDCQIKDDYVIYNVRECNWWNANNLRIKKTNDVIDRVIVKLYQEDKFLQSCGFPTTLYPLNGKPEIFNYENTKVITDDKVLEIFNSVYFEISECYENAEKLTKKLQEAGYNAKSYFGWVFMYPYCPPFHHAWCMLDNSVLDLGDHWTIIENSEICKKLLSNTSNDEYQVALGTIIDDLRNNYPNSIRCAPVGIPTKGHLYIGSPCDKDTAAKILDNLIINYPNHSSFQYINQRNQLL